MFRPLIWLLSKSTNLMLRLLRADPTAFREEISVEELRELVMTHEELPDQERRIVREVFAAGERHVRDAMLPRTEIDFLDASLPVTDAARQAWEHAHSRYPVIDGSAEKVIGFVNVRDLLDPAHDGKAVIVRDIVRSVMVFPATKPLLPALTELQGAGAHIAMVVDEYGGIAGIVTLENLVEKLVGDIYDEFDTVPTPPHSSEPELGEVDGLLSLVRLPAAHRRRAPGRSLRDRRRAGGHAARPCAGRRRRGRRRRPPAGGDGRAGLAGAAVAGHGRRGHQCS